MAFPTHVGVLSESSSQVQVQSHSSLCQQETSACSVSSSSSSLLHTLRHSSSTPGATTAPRLRTAPMLFLQLATIILDWPLRSLQHTEGARGSNPNPTRNWVGRVFILGRSRLLCVPCTGVIVYEKLDGGVPEPGTILVQMSRKLEGGQMGGTGT